MRKKCFVVKAGLIDYKEALKLQENIFQYKKEGKLQEDVVILLQHPPTITIGRKGSLKEILVDMKELKQKGVFFYEIGRGGKVTYHGPGQLVGYPILDLRSYGRDLHLYLRGLEEVIIKTLDEFGIKAHRKEGLTGVWIKNKKVASIGIQVKSWISMHGFALNVNCDLTYFNLIQPCGMESEVMTSITKILNKNIDIKEVEEKLIPNLADVFSLAPEEISLSLLQSKVGYQLIYS